MRLKNLKLELFYIRKAFREFRQGFLYLKYKYWIAPKILQTNRNFEKPVNNSNLSIHILTCKRDIIMMIWAMASFYRVSKVIGKLYIHSDGSLQEQDIDLIHNFFPTAIIVSTDNFFNDYGQQLSSLKTINSLRFNNPEFVLLKKIIDPYFVSDKKYHLIIDSDLLWFKEPVYLSEAIKDGSVQLKSYMMQGIVNDRGNLVYFKDGTVLSADLAHYNSGIVFYAKKNFNLQKLDKYLSNLDINNPANRHFLEQAGYAYSLENLTPLPVDQFQIKGNLTDMTVCKHYTSPRRPLFYIEGIMKLKNNLL